MPAAFALWRRLDAPGHDACRLEPNGSGWRLEGTAVFRHAEGPACIAYEVDCGPGWETTAGRVRGWVGERRLDHAFARRETGWTMNGAPVAGLDHLLDLDLNFTPATNLQQLRRVPVRQGETVELPVAWFNLEADTLSELPQRYRRQGELEYWYEAPTEDFRGLLELAPSGFARRYPELWEAEPG
jgi:hypothetical protein